MSSARLQGTRPIYKDHLCALCTISGRLEAEISASYHISIPAAAKHGTGVSPTEERRGVGGEGCQELLVGAPGNLNELPPCAARTGQAPLSWCPIGLNMECHPSPNTSAIVF